jgi:hypothetical protein
MKIAVVTSSVGANDLLDQCRFDCVDYHAFVDDRLLNHQSIWKTHRFIDFSMDVDFKNRRNAKIYKILPFLFLPGYDYYIWIDSVHKLAVDPIEIINTYLNKSDIAVFKHKYRNCIYDEIEEVKKIKYDHIDLLNAQYKYYKSKGYPVNNGLYEIPCRIQRNSLKIQQMSLSWWEHICKFTSRDQISFPYVCREFDIIPEIMPGWANEANGNKLMTVSSRSSHKRSN